MNKLALLFLLLSFTSHAEEYSFKGRKISLTTPANWKTVNLGSRGRLVSKGSGPLPSVEVLFQGSGKSLMSMESATESFQNKMKKIIKAMKGKVLDFSPYKVGVSGQGLSRHIQAVRYELMGKKMVEYHYFVECHSAVYELILRDEQKHLNKKNKKKLLAILDSFSCR